MRHARRLSLAAALMTSAALTMAAAPASAEALKVGDLNTPGDGLTTIDRITGLEFLDPSVNQLQSYNDTIASPLVTDQGFRYATVDEFTVFLTDAGFTDFSGAFNTTDQSAAENLISNFLGNTIPPGQPFTLDAPGNEFDAEISNGFYAFATTPLTPDGLINVVGVDYQSAALGQSPQDQARVILGLNQVPFGAAPPIVGGLLVRNADPSVVPVPPALGLMGLGLAAIAGGGMAKRRRRLAAA